MYVQFLKEKKKKGKKAKLNNRRELEVVCIVHTYNMYLLHTIGSDSPSHPLVEILIYFYPTGGVSYVTSQKEDEADRAAASTRASFQQNFVLIPVFTPPRAPIRM